MRIISSIKIFMLIAISFISISTTECYAKQNATLIIEYINAKDSIQPSNIPQIIILKNSKEYKILKPPKYYSPDKQTIKNLEYGTYTLIYYTFINKIDTLTIEIKENIKYNTIIKFNYLDYSKEKYVPIISQLQDNESFTICLLTVGCEHWFYDTLVIQRKKEIYTISMGVKSKVLSITDYKKFRHFEFELNYMRRGGCTTVDTYVFKYNNTIKTMEDGSCRWDGYYFLKEQIFAN